MNAVQEESGVVLVVMVWEERASYEGILYHEYE